MLLTLGMLNPFNPMEKFVFLQPIFPPKRFDICSPLTINRCGCYHIDISKGSLDALVQFFFSNLSRVSVFFSHDKKNIRTVSKNASRTMTTLLERERKTCHRYSSNY